LCFALSALTLLGKFDQFGGMIKTNIEAKNSNEVDESFLQSVDYYLVDNNQPVINFKSQNLTFSSADAKLLGVKPEGIVFRAYNLEPIHFKAEQTKVNLNQKEIDLDSNVLVNVENVELKSNRMKISINSDSLAMFGNVQTLSTTKDGSEQILVTASEADYQSRTKYFQYKNQVKGTFKRKKTYEESLNFESDFLNFDGLKNLAELKGNIHFSHGNYNVLASRGNVYLENYNKKLKYYSLSDDVRLEERVESEGRIFTRKALSEKLEGFMSEKRIMLTGLPKVFQDGDVIKGNTIIIRENVETVEVDDANTNITLKRE
jgi:lipopolysaccharide export system protein LptA